MHDSDVKSALALLRQLSKPRVGNLSLCKNLVALDDAVFQNPQVKEYISTSNVIADPLVSELVAFCCEPGKLLPITALSSMISNPRVLKPRLLLECIVLKMVRRNWLSFDQIAGFVLESRVSERYLKLLLLVSTYFRTQFFDQILIFSRRWRALVPFRAVALFYADAITSEMLSFFLADISACSPKRLQSIVDGIGWAHYGDRSKGTMACRIALEKISPKNAVEIYPLILPIMALGENSDRKLVEPFLNSSLEINCYSAKTALKFYDSLALDIHRTT